MRWQFIEYYYLRLYNTLSIPSTSLSLAYLQVPDNIAQEAFAYFEGLSLMSTELGVMDYLHNHEPKFLVQNSEILTITLPKSDRRPAGATLDLAVTTINDQTQKIIPVGEKESLKQLLSLKQQYQLVPDELTTLINIQRAVKGYRSSLDYRMRVASMRMKTFFILIHGRLEGPTIRVKEYVQVDSLFMKDVIEMSDLNSEYMAELPQNIAVDLATVAVENVLGLLENKLRRRNGTVVQSQIMLMLGLTRSESATFAVSSQEDPWMAIISSACSALSTMIDHKALSSSKPTASADLNDSADYKSLSRFVRLGLEMFVLSISCRDIMTAFSENNNTMISSVVTLIQTAQPELVDILKRSKTSSSGISQTFSVYDDQILRVITKALLCLELTLEKNGVIAAFRECDGLAPVKVVIELFMDALSAGGTFEGTAASSASSILDRFDTASKTVLEKSLSVLFVSIQKGRQASVMGITSDSGLTIASDAHFTNLCSAIFQSKYDTNEVLWTDIVMILKEVIDQDPSFLKLFISSLYASDLSKALTFVDGNLPNTFDGCSGSELQELLTPLMKLCHVISITGEGRQYLENSSIVVFILKVIIDPAVLLPKSPPIPIERLTKIGRMLSQLLMDCDLVSPIIKVLLRDSLVSLCVQAKSMYEVVNVRGDTDYDSPRNLLQQKLTNICQLVESMFSENRRQYGDLLRDILQEPVIEALVQAYPCSVATSQQLLAQLSLKNNITFGSNPCSRAISFLVKLAVSSIPQIVLPLLYKEIDNTLSKIGTTKALLESTSAQEDQQSLVVSSSNKDQSESIILVGVLKYIPHLCVIDPQLEAVMPLEKELQIWRLLVSILTVDWLSMLLSHALRSVQRLPGSNFVITNGKDVLRRLFAFHRSSALEIARFAASKWTPKVVMLTFYHLMGTNIFLN